MLEVVNTYLHGFVAMPVISLSRSAGIFRALETGAVNVENLAQELKANRGYCRIVFRTLHILGIVDSVDFQNYHLTPRYQKFSAIPQEIDDLYHLDYHDFLSSGNHHNDFRRWFEQAMRGWDGLDDDIALMLDGAMMVPLLLALAGRNATQSASALQTVVYPSLHPVAQRALRSFLQAKKLAEPGDAFVFSLSGRYLCERALTMAGEASYKPLLAGLRELLLGDPKTVFAHDVDGHEQHVDRVLNVIGSGFQHDVFFRDLVELVVDLFDREPLSDQPRYIVDMGCGDGTLLRTLYQAIAERTRRGRHLERYPLLMIGADFNQKSLDASAITLADVPHALLYGDISQPAKLLSDLAALGINDKDEILHIRSFLDHDRPLPLHASGRPPQEGDEHAYVDVNGDLLTSDEIAQDLHAHLERWAQVVGKHGLILLEVFTLPVRLNQAFFSQTPGFSFDLVHALSRQALVEAATFQHTLARVGLWPQQDSLVRYPKTTPFSRIVLQHLQHLPFVIRPMRLEDMTALVAIDRLTWPACLGLPEAEIRRRYVCYPKGQFVVECEGHVAGVLYTQRIDDLEGMLKLRYVEYGQMHVNSGRYLQLLGLSVHPEYQSLALGDRLIEHVLNLAVLTHGVEVVYGVTRCLDYVNQSATMPVYIEQRDKNGLSPDSVLRFHQSHGAKILRIVADARPEDKDNNGAGILICYDLHDRLMGADHDSGPHIEAGPVEYVECAVERMIQRLMKNPQAFDEALPLQELGLNSMSLMELRLSLSEQFNVKVEPTVFFSYPTPRAIAEFIKAQQTPSIVVAQASPDKTFAAMGSAHAADSIRCAAEQAISAEKQQGDGDIAIVGISFRFPGDVNTQDAFWQMLIEGRCVISQRPVGRWQEYQSELNALGPNFEHIHRGGFLRAVDAFDASFFSITPVEARSLDPQQRLLLELVWQALEDAGLHPASLNGQPVGTFLGAYTHDYEYLSLKRGRLSDIDAYFGTGNALSTAAGRLAYFFNFRGPTVSLDTACSSSSCAIDAACQSLVNGAATLAVAGAVNMMLTPVLSVTFAKAGMLSVDGLCKTFDHAANGYVRSEGGAVLILKRLNEAVRDGNPIYGVIKSVAVMQDGRTNGLTAPNGQAQIELIRRALTLADRTPEAVSYVEAHGTGTYLGDPVEMQALRAVYCDDVQRQSVLQVGSVKTNLGHTEAVSGMAGLIKVILAMRQKLIPPHLHLQRVNELLKINAADIAIPTTPVAWASEPGRPRLAGISSFGFSGTISHLILEEFLPSLTDEHVAGPDRRAWPMVISGKSATALQDNAAALSRYLDRHDDIKLGALAKTLTMGRMQHSHRLAFSFDSLETLRAKLTSSQRPAANTSKIAFMFTGQGSQYFGMGRALAQASSLFRQQLETCRALVQKHAGVDLFDILWGADRSLIDQTRFTQVAIFCIEYSLVALLDRAGIRAAVALGHSVGEFAAACYAGTMDQDTAIRLLCARGELMQTHTREGLMAAVLAPIAQVERLVSGFLDVSIAARNGPSNQVISGDPIQVQEIVQRAEAAGISVVVLPVSRAFHSPLMTPILERFHEIARQVNYHKPSDIALLSNVTGEVLQVPPSADYWQAHILSPVHFERCVLAMMKQGVTTVIEIGPKPVLINMAKAVVRGAECLWLPTLLDADSDNLAAVFASASQALVEVDWRCYPYGRVPALTGLPVYQFQRESYWLESREASEEAGGVAVEPVAAKPADVVDENAHSSLTGGRADFRYAFDAVHDQYLKGHGFGGRTVFPASGYIGLIADAGQKFFKRPVKLVLTSLEFRQMLLLDEARRYQFELNLDMATPSQASVLLQVRAQGESAWRECAAALLVAGTAEADDVMAPVIPAAHAENLSGAQFYEQLHSLGYGYQPPFCGIHEIVIAQQELIATVMVDAALGDARFAVAPWLLDSCFQTVLGMLASASRSPSITGILVPVFIERLALLRPLVGPLHVHCRWQNAKNGICADFRIDNGDGSVACTIRKLECRFINVRNILQYAESQSVQSVAFIPAWRHDPTPSTWNWTHVPHWLILDDRQGYGNVIAEYIKTRGGEVDLRRCAASDEPKANDVVQTTAWVKQKLERCQDGSVLVYSVPIDVSTGQLSAFDCLSLTFNLLRELETLPVGKLARIIMVTRGAQAVTDDDTLWPGDAAAIWGMISAFRDEVKKYPITVVDIAEVCSETDATRADQIQQLLETCFEDSSSAGNDGFDDFAQRHGKLFRRYLKPLKPSQAKSIAADGCYVISGGLGGLGQLCAEFLHERGAGKIVLLSRNITDGRIAWINRLNDRRDCIEVVACDVRQRQDVVGLAARIGATVVKGVIHAAGVTADALFSRQSDDDLKLVYDTKVVGARHLIECLPLANTDFIWLFSSVVGLFGGSGQANYAAANAGLDGYARALHAQGLPCTSINWGPWKGVGLMSHVANPERVSTRLYMDFLDPAECAALFSVILATDYAQVCVARWRSDLIERAVALPGMLLPLRIGETAKHSLREQFLALLTNPLGDAGVRRMRGFIVERIVEITGVKPHSVLAAKTLGDLGLDSLMHLALRNTLSTSIGKPLSATLTFDYPTLDALSRHLLVESGLVLTSSTNEKEGAADPRDAESLYDELAEIEALKDDDLTSILGKEFMYD